MAKELKKEQNFDGLGVAVGIAIGILPLGRLIREGIGRAGGVCRCTRIWIGVTITVTIRATLSVFGRITEGVEAIIISINHPIDIGVLGQVDQGVIG